MTAVIFPTDEGNVGILYPSDCGLSLDDIAKKDIPPGKPYRFISDEDTPKDHLFFNAFEADFSNPDGYGLGYDAWMEYKANQRSA